MLGKFVKLLSCESVVTVVVFFHSQFRIYVAVYFSNSWFLNVMSSFFQQLSWISLIKKIYTLYKLYFSTKPTRKLRRCLNIANYKFVCKILIISSVKGFKFRFFSSKTNHNQRVFVKMLSWKSLCHFLRNGLSKG